MSKGLGMATFHFPITSKRSPVTMIAMPSERPMPRRLGYFWMTWIRSSHLFRVLMC
jgi:hypothetical protein